MVLNLRQPSLFWGNFCIRFSVFISSIVCVCILPYGLLPSPSNPGANHPFLSDRQLCCSQAVKPFDRRTKALSGFKECCLGGKQGWRRGNVALWYWDRFPATGEQKDSSPWGPSPARTFPEHPSSAGMQLCLYLLTKRCHKLFKGFVWKCWERDLPQRVSWTLSGIWRGGEGGGRWEDSPSLHVWT